MLAKVFLSLALLIAAAECAPSVKADRKCSPMQWEAVVLGKVAQINKCQGQVASVVASFAADYSKKTDAFVESVYFDDKFVGNYTYLRAANSSYLFDTINKKCTTLSGSNVFQLCSDSEGLMYKASMSVGGQMVDLYDLKEADRKRTLTVFRNDFVIMSEIAQQTFSGLPQMLAFEFGNVTTGIKDPSIFDVPSYC